MNMDTPGALFMVIRNRGNIDDRLVNVESDIAGIVQIHETRVDANGVASMFLLDEMEIPAGGEIQFRPGSYHIMLMGMKRELKVGELVRFALTFEKAGRVEIDALVKAP